MNIHNINVIARYEVKLLKRSWLFRIFAVLVLLVLTFVQLGNLSFLFWKYAETWNYTAVSSLAPFFTIYLYNVAQSVIVIFLAGSFLKRDKKLDTAEVIYVRPMSNADYIVGKVWGIVRVFMGLNLITMLVTAFINVVLDRSPFDIFPYVFYMLTISLPSLLFILGLAFTVMCFLKNQAVTFVVMLGITGTIFFYLQEELYGVFDFFGVNIPAIFSDVTGHPDIKLFLLQRSIYLLAGIGLICFTITLVKRLPHRPWKTVILSIVGGILLLAGIGVGVIYTFHFRHLIQVRQEYGNVYNKYAALPNVNVISNALSVELQGDRLRGESRMKVQNKEEVPLEKIILWLNPALQLTEVESAGKSVSFEREAQAIVVLHPLQPGEEWELQLRYEGGVDERICYTDIEDKDFLANPTANVFYYRYGKRYVYLEDQFTILTPECVWYPVAKAPVYPDIPYNIKKDFTLYTLAVKQNGKQQTVISQGQRLEKEGETIFVNTSLLPGISLTVGDYEKKAITVDSTDYELYYFRGHDYFSRYFNELGDTLPAVIREIRNDLEVAKNRAYPFKKFVMAETPLPFTGYIRNWKGYTEQVMPEIVFIPERGVTTQSDFRASQHRTRDWRGRNEVLEEKDIQVQMLKNYIQSSLVSETNSQTSWRESPEVNKLNIGGMFFGFAGFIYSPDYPVIDVAFNTMQNVAANQRRMFFFQRTLNDEQRANIYLQEKSFEEALKDRELKPQIMYEILKLKSSFLKNYLISRIPLKEFNDFMKEYSEQHLFEEVTFKDFSSVFSKRFGLDLNALADEWYQTDHSPIIQLKDIDANKVLVEDFTKYQIRFRAYNASDIDAVITVKVESGGGGPGGFRFMPGGGGQRGNTEEENLNYVIPAHDAREVKIIHDERPGRLIINTNVSRNLPNEFTFNFSKVDNEISDTLQGIFPIDTTLFSRNPNEIIIDNEDPGFETIEANQKRILKDLFKKEEEDKYKLFFPWRFPSKWTAVVNNTCYGLPVNSAVYKSKGKGGNKARWTADIPADNYYEISVWNPKFETWGRRRRGREDQTQTYVISYENEQESVSVDFGQEENGWVVLGTFYLPQGKASVTLTDQVAAGFVVADAVKFTLINNN